MSELKHLESSYTDVYQIDVPLRAFNDHPPIRATRVIVSVHHVPDDGGDHTAKIRVSVTGEKIVARNGGYHTEGDDIRVYGLAEEPIRYGLCHDAVLATLALHEIPLDAVADFAFLEEWGEHAGAIDVSAVDLSGSISPAVSHSVMG
ncbi:MAG: hypothetical protein U0R80_07440 [Nocardioidaceae bacterium]